MAGLRFHKSEGGEMAKKALVAVILIALIISTGVGMSKVLAQNLGVGIKIPLQVFAIAKLTENLAIEAGLPLGLGMTGLAITSNVKIFFNPWDLAGIALKPFIGAGATIAVAGAGAGAVFAMVPQGLGGLEFTIPNTTFNIFGEISVFAGVAQPLSVSLGARFDF
jgi:hypothetical protein